MENIANFFKETEEGFIVYVVEQRFAVGRGSEYFKLFKGKSNLIDSNIKGEKLIRNILRWIGHRVPQLGEVVGACFGSQVTSLSILDVISSLCKLFSVESHQAAGPEVIDPIIIEEGNVLPQYLTRIINLHKESVLRPTIIIILKDNDFERAKKILSGCPNGIYVKMIRNSGKCVFYQVVNTGAECVKDFIEAFSRQCFSTCSCTPREVILNDEWSKISIINSFAPSLMKIRSSLLCDEKAEVKADINTLLNEIDIVDAGADSSRDAKILQAFKCITLLNRVFCNDCGGNDIKKAEKIAAELNSDLLTAQVYRYAHFFPKIARGDELHLLEKAQSIFETNNVMDQALYCRNNQLIRQFETDKINVLDFLDMEGEAVYNVPGMVGMSHIYNNVGVAQLLCGMCDDAITSFDSGKDYALSPERITQRITIITNQMISKAYNYIKIDDAEFFRALNLLQDGFGTTKLSFITARLAINIVAAAYNQSEALGKELLHQYSLIDLVQKGLDAGRFGSGQLVLQMQQLQRKYDTFNLMDTLHVPHNLTNVTGIQKSFIERTGYNPVFFSVWL